MKRWLFVLLLSAVSMFADTLRLYLADGTYHLVREYEVLSDRVKFFSTERGQWEEMPLDLVDLKRTESYERARKAELNEQDLFLKSEEKFERDLAKIIAKVPMNTGAYFLDGEEVKTIPQAEVKVNSSKKRSILQVITPIPIVAGKATVELDGKQSATKISTPNPELFMRLAAVEQFGLIKLDQKKDVRVVQTWEIIPVSKETVETQTDIPVFKHELMDGLYKIWPEKPLEPGEYALVEWAPGARNVQVWDFSFSEKK